MKEVWESIVGFLGYEVSDKGRVRSFFKREGGSWVIGDYVERILSQSLKAGRPVVGLMCQGKHYLRLVSRLVASVFLGSCPPGMEVCHNDGNPRNNILENLRYDTHAANIRESRNTKIRDSQVVEIRRLASQDVSDLKLAEEYGVTRSAITGIRTGRTAQSIEGIRTFRYHSPHKLSDDDVQTILRNVTNGQTQASQAHCFGVSESMISRIVNGKRRMRKGHFICLTE